MSCPSRYSGQKNHRPERAKFRLGNVAPDFSVERLAAWRARAAPEIVTRLWPLLWWRYPAEVPKPPDEVLIADAPHVPRWKLALHLVRLGFSKSAAKLFTAETKTERLSHKSNKPNKAGGHYGRVSSSVLDCPMSSPYRLNLPVSTTWDNEDARRGLLV